MVRTLIASTLTGLGYEVRTANSAADARVVSVSFDPEVYCLDIELGQGATGLDLAHGIQISNPRAAFVFLTSLPDPRFIGADISSVPRRAAYLYKSKLTDPNELGFAIEAALRNAVTIKLRDDKLSNSPLKSLSKAQIDVIQKVSLGLSNQEIATLRQTSVRAVENLINRACIAVNLANEFGSNQRVKLARFYIHAAGLPLPK